jgi:hypothetical protein
MSIPRPPARTKPFTMVRRSIWDSERFASLPDDKHRYLYFYFLSTKHQGGAGCFMANPAYILADLKKTGADWTDDALRRGMKILVDGGLLLTDEKTGEVLVLGWWKDNGPTNDKWFKGAVRYCDEIESDALQKVAMDALADCWDAFQKGRGIPTPVPQPGTGAMAEARIAALRSRSGLAAA